MTKLFEKYQIHAYIDGELSVEESREIEAMIKLDPLLQEEVCQLRTLKDQVKASYQDIPIQKREVPVEKLSPYWSVPKAAVASLFLGVFLGVGGLNLYVTGFSSPVISAQQMADNKYIIHLDSAEQDKQLQALNEVKQLLDKGGPDIQVDVISNYQGVKLFDVNSPNRQQLDELLGRYDNLTLYACQRALQRALEKGVDFQVIPQVRHDKPAIDAVVERLNSGWSYIKI